MSEQSRQAYREVRAAEAALQASRQKVKAEAPGQAWRTTLARAHRKAPWHTGSSYTYTGVVQHIGGTLVDCPHHHLTEAAADRCAAALARKLNNDPTGATLG